MAFIKAKVYEWFVVFCSYSEILRIAGQLFLQADCFSCHSTNSHDDWRVKTWKLNRWTHTLSTRHLNSTAVSSAGWLHCDNVTLTFDLLTPKSNRFIFVPRCINDKSLWKIHQPMLKISRKSLSRCMDTCTKHGQRRAKHIGLAYDGDLTRKPSWRKGYARQRHHSKMAASYHLGFHWTANSAIRSADPENHNLEPNMEWIGCTACEIFAFKLYYDLEIGVQGHSRSSKVALFDRAHTVRLYIRLP